MNNSTTRPWEELFPPPGNSNDGARLKLKLLRRNGVPLLLVPENPHAARAALTLYPAQSWRARLARRAVSALLLFSATPGAEVVEIRLDPDLPFARFLRATTTAPEDLTFAMLLGNPRVAGRRFVLLIFGAAGQPVRVVKAGVGTKAGALIHREAGFLKSHPPELLQAPVVVGEFQADGIAAVALEYISGPTPDLNNTDPVLRILGSWLQRDKRVRFEELPVAKRLHAASPFEKAMRWMFDCLRDATFHPALHHGDFAPWNIRVEPATRRWRVLDWERGESIGPPAWDWFHFVIQPAVLVRHASPAAIIHRVGELRQSPAFRSYASEAKIGPVVDSLLLGYLLYCRDVVQQAEGMSTINGLIELLSRRRNQ